MALSPVDRALQHGEIWPTWTWRPDSKVVHKLDDKGAYPRTTCGIEISDSREWLRESTSRSAQPSNICGRCRAKLAADLDRPATRANQPTWN